MKVLITIILMVTLVGCKVEQEAQTEATRASASPGGEQTLIENTNNDDDTSDESTTNSNTTITLSNININVLDYSENDTYIMNYAGVIAIDNTICLFQDYMICNDLSENTWIKASDMPLSQRRYTKLSKRSNGEICVFGGLDTSTNTYEDTGACYNHSSDTWYEFNDNLNNIPEGSHSHGQFIYNDKMYVFGGIKPSGNKNTGAIYDIANESWSNMNNPDSITNLTYDLVVINDKIYTFNGTKGYSYDLDTELWTELTTTDMPETRNPGGYKVKVIDDKFCYFGGHSTSKLSSGGCYDTTSDTWQTMSTTNAPSARDYHSTDVINNKLCIWGGSPDSSSSHDDGACYDPSTDTWSDMPDLGLDARRLHYSVVTDDYFCVFGGINKASNGTWLNDGKCIPLSSF